ncbi:hypothetical protein GGR57DRAFT_475859 [Xylariaceae sp. FL1272]|nr:hypothetical protein GGR57DRAFT_475859 [Xylariaceae sp. FL1272]
MGPDIEENGMFYEAPVRLSEPRADQDAPTRKRQRRKAHKSNEPPIQREARRRAIEDTYDAIPEHSPKRRRISTSTAEGGIADAADSRDAEDPIGFWTREGFWPREHCQIDMEHALARRRSLSSIRRKRSNSATSTTPSDQKPREEKSAQYRDPRYETLLETRGCVMKKSDQGITSESKATYMALLTSVQAIPAESLFQDALFEATCQSVHNRNEARILRDISPLIVPSAEVLAIYGSTALTCLIESTNEGWNNSIPLTGTRPQPDYSVGFRRQAFTDDQLAKLSPFVGDFIAGDLSFFMATYYMYFPFLASEVKSGDAALDVADRQNAHSMTLAARGIVELFRLVKRENEVHRQILSFSISHDHRSVRIYGYYPVINGRDIKYYRHPIHTFDFTALDGKDRWIAYRFTKNIYECWMPDHLNRICSAIDELPSKIDFDVAAPSESTSISHDLESDVALSVAGSGSLLVEGEDMSREMVQMATPETSSSKPARAKRRKSPVKISNQSTES